MSVLFHFLKKQKLSFYIFLLIIVIITTHALPTLTFAQQTAWNVERDTNNNNLKFYLTPGGSATSPLMQLNADGNVGIGTGANAVSNRTLVITPNTNDGVNVTSSPTGAFSMLTSRLGAGSFNGITQDQDRGIVFGGGPATGFVLIPWAGTTSGLRMNYDGNVGISKGLPIEKLDINGNMRLGQGNYAKFYHANEQDFNDGKIGTGMFAPGLNIVGVKTETSTYRRLGLWGQINQYQNDGTNTWAGNSVFAGTIVAGSGDPSYGNKFTIVGNSYSATGVTGNSVTHHGVTGNTIGGFGVAASSTNNVALYASSTNSNAGIFHAVNNSSALYVRSDGTTPGWTTHIHRNQTAAFQGGGMMLFNNYGPANDSNGFFIYAQGGASTGPTTDVEFYVRADGMVKADGTITGGGADVAEWTPTKYAAELEPGDLVMVDGMSNDALTKKSDGTPYSTQLMGIVSTNPGLVSGGGETEDHGKDDILVALTGRVPTKVSTENGSIKPGDLLTSSSTPGVAMKATKAGMVIGKALESFDSTTNGKILVWVQPLWYGGDSSETDNLKQELEILKAEIEKLKAH